MSASAVLFPGQGSQVKGMGRDAAEQSSDAKQLWLAAEKASGLPLREIYWDGEAADMARTEALQPAMATVGLTLWLAARKHVRPAAAAGHSLGEYTALAAAEILAPKDMLELVSLRGKLMSESGEDDHGMAAILKLDMEQAEELAQQAADESGELLIIANYNSPAQYVASGKKAAIEAAARLAKERKGRAVPLPVSGAFHTPLMREAADEFSKALGKIDFRSPKFPVYFNVTGQPEPDPEKIRAIMAQQMTSPVRWVQTMQRMWEDGMRRFIEIGPKGVLAKLAQQNLAPLGEPDVAAAADLAAAESLAAGQEGK